MIFQGSLDERKYPDSLGQSQQWQCMKKKDWTKFTPLSSVFVVDLKQVNICWDEAFCFLT